jgi:dTDP-4-amino-4,6-dideoxy-D-galactose acyltransferase
MANSSPVSLIAARNPQLFFYSPVNFVRAIKPAVQLDMLVADLIDEQPYWAVALPAGNEEVRFYYNHLSWDTEYFGLTTYKLNLVLFPQEATLAELAQAAADFVDFLRAQGAEYVFAELPAEDTKVVQALGSAGLRLIETRLTYYRALADYEAPERYPVRAATADDIVGLQEVARTMRNDFDRFHADPVFPTAQADQFLATYVAESVQGFADIVLVPAPDDGVAPGAFLTARYNQSQWPQLGVPVSKMVLSAVSGQERKGWYRKLISEMSLHLREQGAAYAYMNTQATNRAVFHTWESLGYKLGATTHVLAIALR